MQLFSGFSKAIFVKSYYFENRVLINKLLGKVTNSIFMCTGETKSGT